MSNSTLSDNSAGNYGGGIYATTATVSNSTISSNSANSGGGGIETGAAGTAMVINTTISGNSAGAGGGIRATTVTVSTSTLSGNTASTSGGGIYSSTTVILNSNKFGIAVPGGTPNVAPLGPNVFNLKGNTGPGNDPSTCNVNIGNC